MLAPLSTMYMTKWKSVQINNSLHWKKRAFLIVLCFVGNNNLIGKNVCKSALFNKQLYGLLLIQELIVAHALQKNTS